jgi:dipeptidyl aminopeptidase/acylaminoacyl peptidase
MLVMGVVLALLLGLVMSVAGFAYYQGWLIIELNYPPEFDSPISENEVTVDPMPLDRFSFESLRSREYENSLIVLERVLKQGGRYTSYLFSYQSDRRKVTGMANIPLPQEGRDQMPVVVMLRGFVEDEIYSTGLGTRNAANVFAENGFVTLAPDFLGYGESDAPEDDVWWERLNKPVQVMNLLASLDSLPQVDTERVALWGHSNGGQIALSVLEISGKNYPTSLWAPVSKPFPYSVLYYTDEFDDGGLRLRYALAEFERLYEVGNYSIVKYFDLINASILLHQGTEDDEVPLKWSNELVASLKELGKEVEYFVYPGAGHNMEGNWETVVGRDVGFFRQRMKAD